MGGNSARDAWAYCCRTPARRPRGAGTSYRRPGRREFARLPRHRRPDRPAPSLAPQTVSASADAQGEHWRIAPPPTPDGTRQACNASCHVLARDIEPERVADAELIAEELLTNIARVAESRGRGHISVECSLINGDISLPSAMTAPFDPLAREAPQLDAESASAVWADLEFTWYGNWPT